MYLCSYCYWPYRKMTIAPNRVQGCKPTVRIPSLKVAIENRKNEAENPLIGSEIWIAVSSDRIQGSMGTFRVRSNEQILVRPAIHKEGIKFPSKARNLKKGSGAIQSAGGAPLYWI